MTIKDGPGTFVNSTTENETGVKDKPKDLDFGPGRNQHPVLVVCSLFNLV